jgi:hypothetical protein
MWVHRVTIKTIVDLQKNRPERELADSIYECIGAWRLFEAIEMYMHGDPVKATAIASKVRLDKFTDTEQLLRLQARIGTTYRQQDPFTDTCVAAHQQLRDWQKLTTRVTSEQYERIKARHELYRQCQPELNPQDKETT